MPNPTPKPRLAPEFLTVIIRDDAPMIHCGDSPSYRSVRIELTEEQRRQAAMSATSSSGGTWHFEQISKCFLDAKDTAHEG